MQDIVHLLIRLQEVERMFDAAREGQLTPRETLMVKNGLVRLRELIPSEFIDGYHHAKKREPELTSCPEILAMAAVVHGFRGCTPMRRHDLMHEFHVSHFAA